jgi:hypothetical protein
VAPSLFCTTQKEEEEEVTKVLIKLGASSWNSNLPLQFGVFHKIRWQWRWVGVKSWPKYTGM